MTLFIYRSLSISGITPYHELFLRYSTNFSERESRPFHEEPESTSVSILISTTVLHLVIFCYALSTAGTPTATGVFNLLTFDQTAKKKKKKKKRNEKKNLAPSSDFSQSDTYQNNCKITRFPRDNKNVLDLLDFLLFLLNCNISTCFS